PFIGAMMMSREQKAEMLRVLEKVHGVGELDYVAAWYYKAAAMMRGTDVRAAFVSTNSICQGQQAVTLWKPLFESGVRIRFAHRSFIWDSDAKVKAHVHCVIVGFAAFDEHPKYIYDNGSARRAENINPYLSDAPDVFVESRTAPICDVPEMRFGSMPRDDGGLILSDEQREQLLSEYPQARQWIRPYLGAYEFINRKTRWCLWLKDVDENEYLQCAPIVERLQHVRNFRASSIAAGTRKFAQTPALFCQIAQPDTDYIAVPKTSSQRRRYVPIGFLDSKTVASDAMFLIPDVTLYHFGVLTSSLHNAWMRVVCGRLKSDYRYAKDIVYNNFLWCEGNEEQVLAVEQTARGILEARALYPERSLAELYDEVTMPAPLRKAHRDNDAAVLALYGLDAAENEERWVAELLRRLQAVLEKDKQ
ncbi:MAG: hypothetical protein IJC25_06725, partial [Clostridia bacterium]|nr:hypothetical protein [Clostridia bacterium]